MADWVDSLSDAEVKALYKYKQGGVDSLSDDEVKLMYPHKDKLTTSASPTIQIPGQTIRPAEDPTEGAGLWDKALGAGEAGLQVLSSIPAMVAGPLMGVQARTTGASSKEAEDVAAKQMDAMTYSPRTPMGQEYVGNVGKVMNELLPMAPLHGTIPSIKVSEGVNATKALRKPKEAPKTAVDAAIEALNTPEVATDPNIALYKQRALDQQQAAILEQHLKGQEPIQVGSDGTAVPREFTNGLEAGVDISGVRNPYDVAGEVSKSEIPGQAEGHATDAQGAVDQRQVALEQQVKQQTALEQGAAERQIDLRNDQIAHETAKSQSLDFNAAERARQDAGTIPPAIGPLPLGSRARKLSAGAKKPRGPKGQRGVISEDLLGVGAATRAIKSIIDRVSSQPVKQIFEKFKGTFNENMLVMAYNASIDPKAREHTVLMSPKAFHELAQARGSNAMTSAEAGTKRASIRAGLETKGGLDSVPYLMVDRTGKVVGHEGRHRMDVLASKGVDLIPVRIMHEWTTNEKPFPFKELTRQDSPVNVGWKPPVDLPEPIGNLGKNEQWINSGKFSAEITPAIEKAYQRMIEASHRPNAYENPHGTTAYRQAQTKARNAFEKAVAEEGLNLAEVSRKLAEMNPTWSPLGKKQGGALGWSPSQLKGPVGDILKDIGHSLITTSADAIKLASSAKDVAQGQVGKFINQFTKGGTYLKGKVDNPVVHFAVDKFIDADGRAKSEISTMLHGEYLSDLRDLSHAERMDAFKLLNAADLNKRPLTPQFMQQHGIDPKVQKFIATHQKMMDTAIGRINQARAAVGKPPIAARSAYSAMSMTGDYRKTVIRPELDANGQVVLDKDGFPKGEVVGVIGANSRSGKFGRSLDKLEAAVKAKDPTLTFGPLKDMTKRRETGQGPHAAFQNALETLGDNNAHIQDFLDILREVAKDDSNNFLGMQNHTLQKKGVFGMEGRKQWETPEQNMRDFFDNQVQYLEGVLRWSHLAEASKEVNNVIREKSVIDKHPNAIKLTENYMQNAMGLNPSAFGRGVENVFNLLFSHDLPDSLGISPTRVRQSLGYTKAGVNTSMLSLNPAFLGIQLVQGGAGMPAMAAMLRARGLAPATTITAHGYMAKGAMALIADANGMSSKLSPVERGAIQYAKDNHVYATDMVEHTNQIEKGGTYYATKVTQSPAAMIEKATRAQVYMAFVDMMHQSGLTPKEGLYIQAHRLTDMTMNNYGAMEKPMIYNALGPLGTMAYNLKNYGHNELSRWAMLAREIPKTGTAVPLLTQMAATIAIAGAMGLPFFSQWESIYDTITEKLGTPRSLSMDVMDASNALGEHIPALGGYTLSHGLPSILGADVSKRVGLGDVLSNKASDVAFAGGSKLADAGAKIASVINNPDAAHVKAATLTVMPPIVQSMMKERWYTDDDKVFSMDPDKNKTVTAYVTPLDKKLKQWGVTGINESVQKEATYQLGKIEKVYGDMRLAALAKMSNDLFENGDISQKAIDKYVKGQGDPSTLEKDINKFAIEQNLSQGQLKVLKDASSSSLTKVYDLQRRAK